MPHSLLEKIEKLDAIREMSRNQRILTLIRLGLYKRLGYNVDLGYVKLEDMIEILKNALKLENVNYEIPLCPICNGILTQTSTNLTCLKCKRAFEVNTNERK